MISEMKIGMVPHPHADLMRKRHKPTKYLALSFKQQCSESHLNMAYVDETLKDYLRTKQITQLEYLEAVSLIKEFRSKK